MKELSLADSSEASSIKGGDGAAPQESQLQDVKPSVESSNPETSNARITESINNGSSPEHIDRRLQSELQHPDVQRQLINEYSPYSSEINRFIRTTDELSVYTRNGLQEGVIAGRPCLLMKIDPDKCDAMGRLNPERAALGRAPLDQNNDSINLHHIGQKEDSPLAELPDRVHKECDGILHDKSIATEVHGEGNNWRAQSAEHWKERSHTI
jgi:hypothetical protein